MSDSEIRKILIEEKKRECRREALRDYAEGFIGFASLFALCFLLTIAG